MENQYKEVTDAYNAIVKEAFNAAAEKSTGVVKLKFEMMRDLIDSVPTGDEFLQKERAIERVRKEVESIAETDKAVAETLQQCNQAIKKAQTNLIATIASGRF